MCFAQKTHETVKNVEITWSVIILIGGDFEMQSDSHISCGERALTYYASYKTSGHIARYHNIGHLC